MRKQIKSLLIAGVAMLLAQPMARAFTPAGPIANGGDSWQSIVIGYGWNDTEAPKNIYEEYRPVVPIQYYASDSSYISYFGTEGLTNVDAAFGIFNGVMCGQTNTPIFLFSPTNGITMPGEGSVGGIPVTIAPSNTLDTYDVNLGDFYMSAAQVNYTARTLALLDIKSQVLRQAVLAMGLGDPDRYVWTLHDRFTVVQNPKCPQDEEYLVVQRNFDVSPSAFNYPNPYSSYVNGNLYTFLIDENCGKDPGVPWSAITLPATFGTPYTALAGGGQLEDNEPFNYIEGVYYVAMTRDDVMGLQYLLSTNNINWEATAPSGGQLVVTNIQAATTNTTLPLSLLLAQSVTNSPSTLQTNFPGITFLSVTTNFVTLVTSNVSTYFTNLPPPYTNTVPFSNNMAVYPTNGTILFTNWTPVQYENPPILLTTLPLEPLLFLSQFLDPATLESIYPGLLVGSVQTNFFSVQISTNLSIFFTNQSVLPVFSNTVPGGLPIATHATNIYYFTNQPGPTVINYDTTQPFTTISTMDLGAFVDQSVTDAPAVLQALYPGLEVLRATTSPAFIPVTNYISYLTNLTGAPYEGAPTLVTVAVSSSYQWVTNWHYTFGNVFTNHFSTNRLVKIQSIWITNQIGAPYGSPFIAVTNNKTITTNLISGDFFLIPTNWCGFDLVLSFPLGNPPYAYGPTNTIIYAGYNTNGSVGTNYTTGGNSFGLINNIYDIFTNYNYAVYPGICEPVVALSTNYATNVVTEYQYQFLNVVTNHYYTNSLIESFVTNIFFIPGGSPDLLGTNIVNTSYYTNFPGGDFFIIPTNWCGFQITALLTNLIAPTNIVLTNQNSGSGSAQFTFVQYLVYTNYTYSIRPGQCEPTVGSSTNYSTNFVTAYSYYFGNIVTNHYFTNGPTIIVTTNDAVWTNGLVGMITNIITTNVIPGYVSGDFYIIPPSDCGYTILSTQLTSIVISTNTTVVTNVDFPPFANPLPGEQYSQTVYTTYTNTTFLVQEATCSTAPPPTALRRGLGRVQYIRANYDSLLGQYFQPITNYYNMVMITNSQQVVETYQRVTTQPDFLMKAQDLTISTVNHPYGLDFTVSAPNFDTSAINTGLAGPGSISPGIVFTLNENNNNLFLNGSYNLLSLATNEFLNESDQSAQPIGAWGAFDGSTNYPVIYPSTANTASLMNQIVIQVLPSTLPDATNGVAYSQAFTATGGQPPYTWQETGPAVPGLTFNAGTQTLSGTPTAPGVFTFSLQLTDSGNRVVTLNYPITIH